MRMQGFDMDEALASWNGLNDVIMNYGEKAVSELLTAERSGRRRIGFLLRIHSRLNKLRADRERTELRKVAERK
jgi:hypothetical protein